MAVYIDRIGGYIADNPDLDFKRCDDKVFSYQEVNTASMTNTSNSQAITGGQGAYPLAYIDTDKSLEFTFASSQFTMEMFEMANAANETTGDVGTLETGLYEVDENLKITIPYECQEGSVYIRGFEEATAVAAGKYVVSITEAAAAVDGKTEITFNTGDVTAGTDVRVSYVRRVVDATGVSVLTNATTAKGELYAHWPVYSDGRDCTESTQKGRLHLHIYRVRVTALPGFDNSLNDLQAA